MLLWNFFLSKSFWGKFAQWTIFLLFRFIKYCVDDLLKIYYFKPKIKKSNHSSTHSISISYYCFIKTRMESPSSRASPQINIDKDIYEKQKMENCTLCSQMAGGCGIKMMWKFLGCIFFCFR